MIQISHPTGIISGTVSLPYSKSIINRLLILKHLYFPNLQIPQTSLSNDTQILNRILNSLNIDASVNELNAEDAGTVIRFLQPYLCIKGGSYSLTGNQRLLSRPNAPLIESLTNAGFNIQQHKVNSNITIQSKGLKDLKNYVWEIVGTQSSQFASALIMIAPYCRKSVTIKLLGDLVSLPYMDMTIKLMTDLGINIQRKKRIITCLPFKKDDSKKDIDVERDWSSASYFVGLSCLSNSSEILIKDLRLNSLQGDKSILDLTDFFGVEVIESREGIKLVSNDSKPKSDNIARDYSAIPDLALTEMTIFDVKKVNLKHSGTSHLAHKESDRLINIQKELKKLELNMSDLPAFETYNDHRMAMSLSMIAAVRPVLIKNPMVINKSFPEFWEQLGHLGFEFKSILIKNE